MQEEFTAPREKPKQSKKKKVHEVIVHHCIEGIIMTPAGSPPCKPDNLPDPSDEDVVNWASEIMELGKAKGYNYSYTAIQYWARTFWDVHGPRYKEVNYLIQELFQPSEDIV